MLEEEQTLGEGEFLPVKSPNSRSPVNEIIYASEEEAYFFILSSYLYRKDIDERPPKPLVEINLGYRTSRLKYSEKTNRVFISTGTSILIFNPVTKGVEAALPSDFTHVVKRFNNEIVDFLLLETQCQGLKMLELSYSCELILSVVTKRREKCLARYFPNKNDRSSRKARLEICSKSKLVLLELPDYIGDGGEEDTLAKNQLNSKI